jgi:tRNA modification GTPase
MMLATDDTICAIASAQGGAARGVVRVAGPEAIAAVQACFKATDSAQALDAIRRPRVIDGALHVQAFAAPLPCVLYLWPGPASYTRSAMAELHTIGSPPLLEAVLATLCHHEVRLAQPGEFTMRAFLAGRMDLTQAEAVLGVIDAYDERQLEVALRQLAGGLAGPLADVRLSLLNLLAELEAGLDFVEEDIEFITSEQLCSGLRKSADQVSAVAAQLAGRTDERQLARVALVGSANVGKSTLFNSLVELTGASDHAAPSIVTSQPGTTRDYRTATITDRENKWQLIDTAGIEQVAALDAPGTFAQAATNQQRHDADIRILCLDASRPPSAWEKSELESAREMFALVITTKADLSIGDDALLTDVIDLATSGATGTGLDELLQRIDRAVIESQTTGSDAVASTAARCRESLAKTSQCLTQAETIAATDSGHELVAAELRIALDHLGQVVGVVYTDDILDRIFSQFCIGK